MLLTALTLSQALKATLLYHRHNVTEELLAELFNTSQSTINTLEQALKKALSARVNSLEESLKIPNSLVVMEHSYRPGTGAHEAEQT